MLESSQDERDSGRPGDQLHGTVKNTALMPAKRLDKDISGMNGVADEAFTAVYNHTSVAHSLQI